MNHIVVVGETLGTIAAKYLGSSSRYKEILAENPQITNPNVIKVGQILRIPTQNPANSPVVKPISVAGSHLNVSPVQSEAGYTDQIKGLLENKKMLMLLGVAALGTLLILKRK